MSPRQLEVQRFLSSHSLKDLKTQHGINTSAKVGDLFFSLNYDQIESKPTKLVNQCRALILGSVVALVEDQVSGTMPLSSTFIISESFTRFFNLGDSNAESVDLEDKETVVFEKLDGTLTNLYWNPVLTEWCVGTRSVPLADKAIDGWKDWTFRKLFEKALTDTLNSTNSNWFSWGKNTSEEWRHVFNAWTAGLDKDFTYMFELTSPLNRVVVEYKDYRIHWLGTKNTKTGIERYVKDHSLFGVPPCPSVQFNNLTNLIEFVNSKSPTEMEGIVVRDKNFNRVKIKNLAYLSFNKIKSSTANSPRAVMELILVEKLDDAFPILEPHVQAKALEMQENLRKLIQKTDEGYEDISMKLDGQPGTNPRKDFALAVQATNGWMAPLMDRFTGKCSGLKTWIQNKKDSTAVNGGWSDSFLDGLVDQCEKMKR